MSFFSISLWFWKDICCVMEIFMTLPINKKKNHSWSRNLIHLAYASYQILDHGNRVVL